MANEINSYKKIRENIILTSLFEFYKECSHVVLNRCIIINNLK